MNLVQTLAFVDELEKTAAAPQLLRKLWGSGAARAGAGAAIGAGAGALAGDDPVKGALLGAGLGAGAGYGAILATRAGRQQAKEGLKRIYKAQAHGLTGRGNMPISPKTDVREAANIRKAQREGLTSIPGVVKGLAKNPKKVLRESWHQAGPMGKAMAGLDVGLSAPRILDSTTEEGAAEKSLDTLGTAGGYLIGGRMGFLPSMLFASGTGAIGRRLGRGIDYVTGHRKGSPAPTAQSPTSPDFALRARGRL